MTVRAKVARILSDYELVLNAGEEHGVEEGHSAQLYESVEVSDPDTGEPLGSVRKKILGLEITQVQERLSVARSSDIVRVSNPLEIFGGSSQSQRRVRRKITDTPGLNDSTTVLVSVGDEVIIENQ